MFTVGGLNFVLMEKPIQFQRAWNGESSLVISSNQFLVQ